MFGEDMKFETKIFSIFLILCMLAGVFANSRSDESIFEDFSFFSNKTTLRVWYTDDAITPYLQSMAIKFSEKNREARVEPKLVSGMEYLEAVNKASMENKNLPDIFVTTNDTLEKVYCAGLALEADNSDGFFNKVLFDPEGIKHKPGELPLLVNICVPEKDRCVIGRPPASFRVVGIFDDKGEALHDPAHGDTGLLRIF